MNYEKISVRKDTKDLLINECVKEYLAHHPEFKCVKITQDMILRRVIEFYLKN